MLVTGAEGFLGRAVTRLLENSGKRVIALDKLVAPESRSQRTTTVACDVRNKAGLEVVFEQHQPFESLIHLAAILPTAAQRDPVRATEVNIDGGLHLLHLAQRFRVRRFVFGSSLSIYGTCAADQVVSEADRAAPEDLYGVAKLYVEQMGAAYAATSGMEFVSLRIGRVVGPGAQSTTSAWRSQIFELLQTNFSTDLALPYVESERVLLVHVDDAARALVMLLQQQKLAHTIYNAPCESWTVRELKQNLQALNPKLSVRTDDRAAKGNPRLVDWSRFRGEFGFSTMPIAERLKAAAQPGSG